MSSNNWEEKKLNEIYDFASGLSKGRDEFGFGYPFLSYSEIYDNYFMPDNLASLVNSTDKERDRCSIKRGDVFLTRTSEVADELGISCVALRDYPNATFNGFTKRLRPKANCGVLPEYAGYFFRSNHFRNQINSLASLTTRASLNNGMLEILKIIIPPIKIQESITAILLTLDAKINLNKLVVNKLDYITQTIYKSWFIDFEMSKDNEFIESEYGIIPKGWRIISLSEIMKYAGGSQPPASEFVNQYKDGYVRFIQIRDFVSDAHITYIPISNRNKLCDEYDILIARYGASLGRICYGLSGAYNVALAKVIPIKEYYSEFLRSYLSSKVFYIGINDKGGRSAQAGFNQGDIDSFKLAFPNEDSLVEKFNDIATKLYSYRLELLKQNRVIIQIRDSILPKLISGEIKVT